MLDVAAWHERHGALSDEQEAQMSRSESHLVGAAIAVWSVVAVAQPSSPPQSRFFDSDGVRIHYNDRGSGAPVVLLHGYAMNVANTARTGLAERLVSAGYRVLAVDARGHGQSAKPHAPSAYGAEMARDVVRLLDHLKLTRAHLVGYSMGAIVSNKVRELYPERVRSVVLGGAGWQKQGDYALADLTGSQIADALDRTGSFEDMLRRFSANQVPPPTNEEIGARNLRMVEGNDLKALAAVMRAWDGFAVPEENLRQNAVPTLAIVAALDPLKAKVDALVPVMRNLEVVVIPGADHGALSHPQFSAHVIDFLKRHTMESSAPGSNAKQRASSVSRQLCGKPSVRGPL
jgi:pimeloyl-ACP methyl ester carboxylesterase